MPEHPALLEVSGLTLLRAQRRLFSGLTFRAGPGELIHLHGPNGCGKTTLMRALAGLVEPAEGSVRWRGVAVTKSEQLPLERLYIGHQAALNAELSGRKNLAFACALGGISTPQAVENALQALNARSYASRPVRQLSAGQRQRLSLARLVAIPRTLWMLDEPFTALDAASRQQLEALIDAHLEGGGTVLIATHQEFSTRHQPELVALDGGAA